MIKSPDIFRSANTLLIALFVFGMSGCRNQNNQSEVEIINQAEPVQNIPAVVYRSVDGGRTWVSFDLGVPGDATVSSFLVLNNRVFAATDYHGIYLINEGESTWKRVDKDLPVGVDINVITAVGNALIIGTLKHGLWKSKNNGTNWDNLALSFGNSPIRSLHAKGSVLFAGADNGIYLSEDSGATWKHVFKGVQVNGFTELDNNIYAALMNGAMASGDNGLHWNYIYEPHTLHDISTDGQRLYAMTLGGGLKSSVDNGITWEVINNGLGTHNFYTFELKNLGDKIFAAQWHGIYRSDNYGKNWTLIKGGLPDSTAFSTLDVMTNGLIAGIGLRKK